MAVFLVLLYLYNMVKIITNSYEFYRERRGLSIPKISRVERVCYVKFIVFATV